MPSRSQRAARATGFLAERDPALASLALWCDIHDAPGDTRTQGQTILIGERFTALPLREQIGTLGHHILHVALRHPARVTEQLVTLRVVQTLTLIDMRNHRRHVWALGAYAEDGDTASDLLRMEA